ncbi:unnamed protein product [Didymodactylos carnosus]|uniref:S-phase kinase-associated protein 1 n=1 Tax=Didymodactylos carnosus TaxID=1234261 RepID=A0A814CK15_9BILA|nr:unnamed protein product [Didymodactylos carnosus]CAF1022720.1 unnamed protein product [Didymodactylos carnosus]CAF3717675.1 unnamed protein product [Didymodactylos carnosus]CAF3791266.1 unnamed protein product [Didymodactylos carnosus]
MPPTTSTESTEKIKISSNDGVVFEIGQDIIKQSSTIKEMCSDLGDLVYSMPTPLPNVKASILKPIIDFCEHHKDDQPPVVDDDDDDPNKDQFEPKRSDDISEWDQEFIKQFTVKEGTLFDIIMAANYLGIKTLLAVGCKTIANMVRGKASTEVREMFNISYDPPGQGLNAPQTPSEGDNSTPSTPLPTSTQRQSSTNSDTNQTPAVDPMNE